MLFPLPRWRGERVRERGRAPQARVLLLDAIVKIPFTPARSPGKRSAPGIPSEASAATRFFGFIHHVLSGPLFLSQKEQGIPVAE